MSDSDGNTAPGLGMSGGVNRFESKMEMHKTNLGIGPSTEYLIPSETKATWHPDQCSCSPPEMAVDSGTVGIWDIQVLYCAFCETRIGLVISHADGGEEGGDDDE